MLLGRLLGCLRLTAALVAHVVSAHHFGSSGYFGDSERVLVINQHFAVELGDVHLHYCHVCWPVCGETCQ